MLSKRLGPIFYRCFPAAVGIALFALATVYLLSAAPSQSLWLDEAFGIYASLYRYSFLSLIKDGAQGQGSCHPLYYLLESSWLAAWNFTPQAYWNLRFFFRILPAIYFGAAVVLVYGSSLGLLNQLWFREPRAMRILVAAAFASFFLKIDFIQYYGMQARPYSLWMLLSTAHLIITVKIFCKGWGGFTRQAGFCLLSVGLCTVASPGLFQLILSGIAIFWAGQNWRKLSLALPAVAAALYYLTKTTIYGYAPSPLADFFLCLKDVAYKSFHVRNGIAFFSVSGLCFGALYRCRHISQVRIYGAYVIGLLALCPVLYALCLYKGFLLASRQYIFMVPVFASLYFFTLWNIAYWLEGRKIRFFPRAAAALGIWSILILTQALPDLIRRAAASPNVFQREPIFGQVYENACNTLISVDSTEALDELNRFCQRSRRKLAETFPAG